MTATTLPTRILAPWAPTVLRVTLGVVMAAHGWQKLTAMTPSGFADGMLAGLGVPAPGVAAWAVTLVELLGGIALVLGLGSRVVAAVIALLLAAATVMVKLDLGLIAGPEAPLPGAELDLMLIAAAIAVILLGPGRLALDNVLGLEEPEPTGA